MIKCKPWYLTIPAEGVDCWVADHANVLRNEMLGFIPAVREGDSIGTHVVYGYIASDEKPFHAFDTKWKLAVPVDLELRLTKLDKLGRL